MQNFYQGVMKEFIGSNQCRDTVSCTAILALIKGEHLVNNLDGYLSVDALLVFPEQEDFVEAVIRDIDDILHGVFTACAEQNVSAISYLVKSINDSKLEGNNPFLLHENRRDGVLYENMLASALYGNKLNEGIKIIAGDAAIISAMATTLILELAASFKEWLGLPATTNETYKLIAKYKNSQVSISQDYIVSLFELIGIDKLNEKSKQIAEVDVEDIGGYFDISQQELAQIGMKNKDDLLIAIYTIVDSKNGVFKAIADHPYFAQIEVSENNISPEVEIARKYQVSKSADLAFWAFLSSWALKAIGQAYNKYRTSQRSDVPAPPTIR